MLSPPPNPQDGETSFADAAEAIDRVVAKIARVIEADRERPELAGSTSEIHDVRVALRRLRSLLRTFGSLFERGFASDLRAELNWYSTLLGTLRDLEVIEERLARLSDSSVVLDQIATDRAEAITLLFAARASERFERLHVGVTRLVLDPPYGPRASGPARTTLGRALERPWRDFRDARKTFERRATEADLHTLRIRAKELRYGTELVVPVFATNAERLAKAARKVQDSIGVHRDATRTIAYVRAVGERDGAELYRWMPFLTTEKADANASIRDLPSDLRRTKKAWRKLLDEIAR